jgi:hypothetical protein
MFSEEQEDDRDFEFDDRADAFVHASTIPAPPPLEALGDSSLEEDVP